MGERKQAKGGVGGRQRRQAPLRLPGRQGQQATNRASPPTGNMGGRVIRQPSPCAPPQAPLTPAEPMPPGFRSRGCKGRSPLHIRKLKISPFPLGRGSGGWGQKIYDMAGKTGEAGHSPPRVPDWQGRQAAKKASPPAGAGTVRSAGDQPGKPPLGTENGRGTPATPEISLSSRSAPGSAPEGG